MDSTVNHVSRLDSALRRSPSASISAAPGSAWSSCTTAACDVVCAAPLALPELRQDSCAAVVGRMTDHVARRRRARRVDRARATRAAPPPARSRASAWRSSPTPRRRCWARSTAAPGVLVLAGTGSIVLGRDGRGRVARAGGLGPLIGDEGSAFWLGREWLRLTPKVAGIARAARPAARRRRAHRRVRAPRAAPRAPRGSPRPGDRRRRPGAPGGAGRRGRAEPCSSAAPVRVSWSGSVAGNDWYRAGLRRALARRLRAAAGKPPDRRRPGRRPPGQPPGRPPIRWGATAGAAPLPPFITMRRWSSPSARASPASWCCRSSAAGRARRLDAAAIARELTGLIDRRGLADRVRLREGCAGGCTAAVPTSA